VIVVGFQAPLSFLNAYDFRRDTLAALKSSSQKIRLLVLEATGIVEIDFTAAQILTEIIRQCHDDGVDFAIARLESTRAQDALVRFGIAALLRRRSPVSQRGRSDPRPRSERPDPSRED